MARPQGNPSPPKESGQAGSIEMPRPTIWPIVLGMGITLLALGAATSKIFCAVGGVIFIVGLLGWIAQLLPGRGHEHEPLVEPAQAITPRLGAVEQLKPGVVGYRFQLPEKVHPVSAGIKGGIVGGLLMPLPALTWGVLSGHGIWFPINLLVGMVVPGMGDQSVQKLEAFQFWPLIGGIIIHAIMSISIGLVYGVILPTLPPIPGGPLVFGGLILPLLWTGASHSLMGVVNPVLNEHVDWPWFVASQFIYGVAASIVIMRSEKIPIAPRGPGGDAGGPSPPKGWVGCLAICCVLLSGCNDSLPGKPLKSDAFVMPQDILSFSDLYGQRCAGCHGADGTLGPGPPLNDPLFIALISHDGLRTVIGSGRHGSLMPAWLQSAGGPLTDAQVSVLVDGIKSRKWKSSQSKSEIASPEVSPNAPPLALSTEPSSAGTAEAGKELFVAACGGCHGPSGLGTKVAGRINDPAFLTLMSDQILRRYIITGRRDLGMPDFAGQQGRSSNFKPLTSQQVSDLVALLAQWRTSTNSER